MGIEIERKFLLKNNSWKTEGSGLYYKQGYLSKTIDCTIRLRIAGDNACLTIKGRSNSISRIEYEYEIPVGDAEEMLDQFCEKPYIEKHRYRISFGKHVWEIDEFHGDNNGLYLAEIELSSEDEKFDLPPWIGDEVSGDSKYYNSNLSKHPFAKW